MRKIFFSSRGAHKQYHSGLPPAAQWTMFCTRGALENAILF
jgi:hypothetical protein